MAGLSSMAGFPFPFYYKGPNWGTIFDFRPTGLFASGAGDFVRAAA
jgi:hypothetical protein